MSSSEISTTKIQAILSESPKVVDVSEKTGETTLETIKEKFREGKACILKHKQAFANLGQIGGTAALVAGGAALLFSGIAANLTIAGIPLGIPLMVAGSILFLAGTALQIAHHVEKEGLTVAEKLKSFFRETLANLTIGTLTGAGVATACSALSLASLITVVSVAIKFRPLLFAKPDEWKEAVRKVYNESESGSGIAHNSLKKSSVEEALKSSESFSDFVKKLTKGIPEIVGGVVNTFEQSSADRLASIFPSKEETPNQILVPQVS